MRSNIDVVTRGMSEGFTGAKTSFVRDHWDDLYDALQTGAVLQGQVGGVEKDGLVVFIGNVKGVIPEEEVGEPRPKHLSALVGASVFFKVKHPDRSRNIVYLSRRDALAEMSEATWRELKGACARLVEIQEKLAAVRGDGESADEKLSAEKRAELRRLASEAREAGPVRTATVRAVLRDGAYVDLGGVAAFLPGYEMSWKRVDDARDVVRPGQSFDVKIVRIDVENRWIRVSLKALLPDPWETVSQRYTEGGTYGGVFLRTSQKGNLVVELEPGINVTCGRLPLQRLKPGQGVRVKVLYIDPANRYIRGSIAGETRWAN